MESSHQKWPHAAAHGPRGSRGGLSNPRERLPLDARDVFTRDLELPRARERERVWARDSDVTLRGSEVRTLATVGAFRVVPAGDLRDGQDRPLDPHRGDLRHLRDQGLVETIPTTGDDRALVVLTERGRDVLERNRWSSVHREELRWEAVEREFGDGRDVDDERSSPHEPKARQEFYAGVRSGSSTRFAVHRPRELTHDAQVYRAYLNEAERLREDGAFISPPCVFLIKMQNDLQLNPARGAGKGVTLYFPVAEADPYDRFRPTAVALPDGSVDHDLRLRPR